MGKFKETEFGTIPADWDVKTILELKADEKSAIAMGPFGSNIKAENFVPEGVPVIRGTNLNYDKYVDGEFVFLTEEKADELKGSNCTAGDLVFTHRGTIGQVGLIPEGKYPRYVISQSGMKLTVDKAKINNEFLFYFFKSKYGQYQLLKNEGQVGVPSISNPLSTLKEIEVPVPPLKEQKIIAEILSSIDNKIDVLNRQNKTIEKITETLFKNWFMASIGNGWKEKTMGDFIETTLGGEWGKESPEEEYQFQVQCIRGTDIADLKIGIADRTPIRFIKKKKYENIEVQDGDLIIEISGGSDGQSTGRTIYINDEVKALFKYPLVFSNFCRLIRPKDSTYSLFLYSFINYLYEQGDLFNLENGSSGIRNLDYKALLFKIEYRLPDHEEAVKYHHDVKAYFSKINKNKQQMIVLSQLRNLLLPRLMSGEVRVKA